VGRKGEDDRQPDQGGSAFQPLIRIPGWARGEVVPSDLYRYLDNPDMKVTLKLNGKNVPLDIQKGYAVLSREWKSGDTIELALPMPVRRVAAHEAVKDNKGRVALERGPIVFCAEFADNKDGQVLNLVLEDGTPLKAEFQSDLLNGVMTVKGQTQVVRRTLDGKVEPAETVPFKAIPYYAWAHRGRGPMTVWVAREPRAAKPLPADTLTHTSKITVSSGGTVEALTINSNRTVPWTTPCPTSTGGQKRNERVGATRLSPTGDHFRSHGLLVRRHRHWRMPSAQELAFDLSRRRPMEAGRIHRAIRSGKRPLQHHFLQARYHQCRPV
jgi:hypothetical protein